MDFPTPSSLADLLGLSLGEGLAPVEELAEGDLDKAYLMVSSISVPPALVSLSPLTQAHRSFFARSSIT